MATSKMSRPISTINIGDQIGRLTVLSISDWVSGKRHSIARCRCSCGNDFSLPTRRLRDVRSCGCIRKEKWHHKAKTDIYAIWTNIKARCLCVTNKQYLDYGGRGIKLCLGFRDFLHFEMVMGERPSKTHSVDRIDNNFHYCCGECDECFSNGWSKNVRWATPMIQSSNKRTNLYLEYNGKKLCLSEVAREIGMSQSALHQRIVKLKWSVEEATTIPTNRANKYIHKGNIGRNQFSKL